jgi:hypothetical protein
VLAQLVVERAREADLPELRCVVDGLAGEPAQAGDRRQRHEIAAAGVDQVRQRGGGRVDGALQVHVDHRLDVLWHQVEEVAVHTDAGVGDDAVERSKPPDHLGDGGENLFPVGHVAAHAKRAVAEPEIVAGSRQHPDLRAGVGETPRNGRTDPAAGSGDQGHATVEGAVGCQGGCHPYAPRAREIGLIGRILASVGTRTGQTHGSRLPQPLAPV